ncbi:hypothetical protein [Cypionkella sp.]|uniref:hypothetical protein n=1 Tax=Cypionkella sp. TaxID=2811411 RepID=UPI002727EE28|nr:hypothetical protein [Cypionkella sp.]MDO8986578.1 hypothetical protein [Cypionkella sp.]MDP2050767.1 hypothetical protein [Cypionkella sp.]
MDGRTRATALPTYTTARPMTGLCFFFCSQMIDDGLKIIVLQKRVLIGIEHPEDIFSAFQEIIAVDMAVAGEIPVFNELRAWLSTPLPLLCENRAGNRQQDGGEDDGGFHEGYPCFLLTPFTRRTPPVPSQVAKKLPQARHPVFGLTGMSARDVPSSARRSRCEAGAGFAEHGCNLTEAIGVGRGGAPAKHHTTRASVGKWRQRDGMAARNPRRVTAAEAEAGVATLLATHDADKKGALSEAEFATLFAEVTRGMAARPFAMLDDDGDKEISAEKITFPVKMMARMGRLTEVNVGGQANP